MLEIFFVMSRISSLLHFSASVTDSHSEARNGRRPVSAVLKEHETLTKEKKVRLDDWYPKLLTGVKVLLESCPFTKQSEGLFFVSCHDHRKWCMKDRELYRNMLI